MCGCLKGLKFCNPRNSKYFSYNTEMGAFDNCNITHIKIEANERIVGIGINNEKHPA